MRTLFAPACLVCLLGCGPGKGEIPPDGKLSVLNFNLLHGLLDEDPALEGFDGYGLRMPQVVAELERQQPAVVFLQEVFLSGTIGYPNVAHAALWALNRKKDRYSGVYASIFSGDVTYGGGAGLGQLTLTRLPIRKAAKHSLVGVGGIAPRIAVHVQVDTGDGLLDTYNVHLEGPDAAAPNTVEMNDLIAFIESSRAMGGSVLIGGDFNSDASEPVFDLLTTRGYVELAQSSGLRCTQTQKDGCTNSSLPLNQPGERSDRKIDHLWLLTPRNRPTTCHRIFDQPVEVSDGQKLFLSDHIGLTAEF